jgi:hypothetical protein
VIVKGAMKTFEYDFRYLQAGFGELESYLLSKEVFWPIDIRPNAGEPGYPELTLGGMLLSRARLIAYQKSPDQEERLAGLLSQTDSVRSKWRVAWENKALHNFSLRLRMWRDYIEEYRHEPQDNADRYPYEVRLRTMLALLKMEGGGKLAVEVELLGILDKFLRTALIKDGFVWEAELQSGFPENIFWFLYGRLPSLPMNN